MASFHGTSGDDTLTGTAATDMFDVTQGGRDTVSGLGGSDTIDFGAAFTAADRIDGGTGSDTIKLDGDYSAGANLQVSAEGTSPVTIDGSAISGKLQLYSASTIRSIWGNCRQRISA
jgi:hypothetical protein